MRPTEELMAEHRAIAEMLEVLGAVAQRLEAGAQVEAAHLELVADFIRVFADKCHHGKEEELLFPAVTAGDPAAARLVSILLAEHALGRRHVADMTGGFAGYRRRERAAALGIAASARAYASLLTRHIAKEDRRFFPLADAVLTPARQQELQEAFARLERERIGPGKHEEMHGTLRRLAGVYLREA